MYDSRYFIHREHEGYAAGGSSRDYHRYPATEDRSVLLHELLARELLEEQTERLSAGKRWWRS